MNRYIADSIDDFFSSHLKNYSEKPEENIWNEIDKKLPADQGNKRLRSRTLVGGIAAILLFGLCIPFLTKDGSMHHNTVTQNKIIRESSSSNRKTPVNTFENMIETNHDFPNKVVNKRNAISTSLPNALPENYSVVVLENKIQVDHLVEPECLDNLARHDFIINNPTQSKKQNELASTRIRLRKKHFFSLMPFFSADHITGRFIEQYEFDNLDENDLKSREKPDMSFTVGMLAGYQLNKKLSIVSGISYSSSNLSITDAAVKALQNSNGEYIFKLTTSYGFAEITRSGVVPAAGDSLLVSDAGINFNYISIPLMINYDLSEKKLKFSVHGGVAFNTLISEKVETEYKVQNNMEAETINKIEGIKKTFFTLNTGIEAKFALNHRTDISIGPELRYGINSINKGTPVKTYPVNYGLSLKTNFKL